MLKQPAKITIAAAMASTLLLVLAALLWSLMSGIAAGTPAVAPEASLPPRFSSVQKLAYLSFSLGVVSLFVSVGASGWIASGKLGIATTAGAATIGIVVVLVLGWASQFRSSQL